MADFTLKALSQPEEDQAADPLTALLRAGARALIAQAAEAKLQMPLDQHAERRLRDGRQAFERNGYLPERTVQTGIGDDEIAVPKVRDRSGSGIRFDSTLLPPYLKRARSVEALLPWLYLKGVIHRRLPGGAGRVAGRPRPELVRLNGQPVAAALARCSPGLVPARPGRSRYVFRWVDGVYSRARGDARLCLLVIIGVAEHGRKEWVAVEHAYRESEASWSTLLSGLQARGLTTSPKPAIGDGALPSHTSGTAPRANLLLLRRPGHRCTHAQDAFSGTPCCRLRRQRFRH